ncbi:MAG: membrane protein insertase YidC [Nocardioidaceae bacterium]|nr:membrane protein insertase YidC [Nocardioidaceae bacterium]MDQ3326572.1 membrane protein insertase YidC [Actinomycetota bacterium]
MTDLFNTIMFPLYWVVSWVLMAWHSLFSQVLPEESGWTWALSIIGLTLVVRAALIPLFVKQIKSSRNMQMLQPKVKELQKKYGHDRERLAQETMALYKDAGTNPFASCLPILMQAPIFVALFRVLNKATQEVGLGVLTDADAVQLDRAALLGVEISNTFITAGGNWAIYVLCGVLVLLMTATTFTTQRQLMRKNMPASALTGPYAQQQKMLLYILPVAFGFGGIFFPVGVLLYWSTSNLWTMGQQFYVIRNNPSPGTPAFDAKVARDVKKGKISPEVAVQTAAPAVVTAPKRQQPKKSSRSQRRRR